MDREDARLIEEALAESDRVDSSLVRVRPTERAIVLEGTVPTPEEADAAILVAERLTAEVVSRLSVDPGLREGIEERGAAKRAQPPDEEVLVGSTDILAGPEAEITTDSEQAFSENEPWDPPDDPLLPATAEEYRSAPEHDEPAPGRDPKQMEEIPSGTTPDPSAGDPAGARPPEGADDFPSRLPDASPGEGAVGEGTAGGRGLAGEPSPETGARGADTEAADPARSITGTTAGGTGTHRGPEAEEDPARRDEFPDSDPEERPR